MQGNSRSMISASILALCTLSGHTWAAGANTAPPASTLRISSGFDYSTGNYGSAQTTTITSVPVVVAWDQGPLTLKLALPWVQIDGTGTVVPGVGQVRRGAPVASSSASGMGDAVAYATWNLLNDPASQFGLDLTGKVKFATADENKGLGTGSNDYAVLTDVYKRIGRSTVFATLGYHMLGSSAALPLNNVWSASAGASYKLSEVNAAGFSFDTRQKASATGAPQRELLGFVSHRFDQHWKGQAYVLKGFSDGSPDWGGGVTLGYSF